MRLLKLPAQSPRRVSEGGDDSAHRTSKGAPSSILRGEAPLRSSIIYFPGRLQRTVKTDSTEHTEAMIRLSSFVVATHTETAKNTSLQIHHSRCPTTDAPPRDCWTQRASVRQTCRPTSTFTCTSDLGTAQLPCEWHGASRARHARKAQPSRPKTREKNNMYHEQRADRPAKQVTTTVRKCAMVAKLAQQPQTRSDAVERWSFT